MKPFHVYILACADGSYYTGHTDDIDARMSQHHDGQIGYTATRKPVTLMWQGEFETREGALAFEIQVKGWSRTKKEALMRGDWDAVQRHAWGIRNPLPAHLAGKASIPQTQREGENASIPQREREGKGASIPQPEREKERGSIPQREREERTALVSGPERLEDLARASDSDPLSAHPDPSRDSGQGTQRVSKGPHKQSSTISPAHPEASKGSANALLINRLLGNHPQSQRRAIAKAITLLESTRADHRAHGDELLTALLPHTGKSLRLGISGVPGVGKSTFIEVLGLYLIERGHRVAVLTIDPSSSLSGGSILGDKTRMEKLSVHDSAYIRPSPSSGTLGGVAEKTREAMLVCEAAGYDIVIVETVGVGQSETAVANMTDMFILMQLPNSGDDLQAIKKGVMELADLVVINKADIDPDAATRAEAQITSAMRLFGLVNNAMDGKQAAEYGKRWHPRVLQLSALQGQGVDKFWAAVTQFKDLQTDGGRLESRRQQQALSWMWERIDAGLKLAFRQDPAVKELLPELMHGVASGRVPASTAARNLLAAQVNTTRAAIK
jgi:LAO/AO transport system kinase